VHPLREQRKEMRVQAVGLGELPSRFGNVADLARIRDHHGSAAAAKAATSVS
jgi:hypothetical protein